jgi:hypothetical protein
MWAAGVAAAGVPIALWEITGRGFHALVAGVAGLLGLGAVILGGSWTVLIAVVALALGAALAGRPVVTAALFAGAAVSLLVTSGSRGGWLLTATGAAALGGVTDGMILGHWYLVKPRMPRWALQRINLVGLIGVLADAAVLIGGGALVAGESMSVVGWAFAGLSVLSVLMLVAVGLALRERGYSAVMAATGLFYLAELTVLGAVVTGRYTAL